jgi:NADH-quinone oxidoreductase subunit N
MPPLAGFIAKFMIFASAVDAGLIWLAVIGVLNSIVGLYYYLTVLKYVYLYRSEDEEKRIPIPRTIGFALGVLTVLIILLGTVIAPFFGWTSAIASSLF